MTNLATILDPHPADARALVSRGNATTYGDLRAQVSAAMGKMDETTQLNTVFQGVKANMQPLIHEWVRPLQKKDRTYIDNEIIRYFKDFEQLNQIQKQYVLETMRLWAASGLLQIVRKSEGDCAMGNVKHGAATSHESGPLGMACFVLPCRPPARRTTP